MQLVGWFRITEDDDEWTIEELGAVDLDLICEGVPWKLRYVSFQVKDVQA